MNKKFTKLMAALALLVFMTPTMVGWGQSTTYNFSSIPTTGWSTSGGSQTINSILWTYSSSSYIGATSDRIQIGSKNNPQTTAWTIQTPISSFGTGKKIIAVSITAYTTATTATYDISVGGNSVNSGSLTTSSATYTANNLNVTSGNIVVTMTGSSTSKAMYLTNVSVTYEDAGGGNTPSITANDVNITYDDEDGEIAYTINNPVDGGSIAASVTSDWLTVDGNAQNTTTGSFEFLCDANPSATVRTATVTLTYTYNTNETVTKDVTVTQAGNPNAFNNISDIDSENTHYKVKGTVLAVSARAFVLGDGTGYVYYYNGYSAPSVAVNDKKIVEGTTSSYGHVIQFPNSATITATGTSNYNNTPVATVITAIPDYTSGLHLSDYFQFEGTLTKSSGYYYVSCGEGNINIAYPSSTQQTAMNALENKTVRVKGYFAGINSSNYFSVILESVEEVANPSIEATPSPFTAPSYVVGTDEPTYNVLTVNGSNLTANISLTLNENSDFEMSTDLDTWSSSLTLTQANGSVTNAEVAIRLKAGLAKGNYTGTVALSSTDAQNVEVSLSGTVTGQLFNIVLIQPTGGTIAADLATAEEGAIITLSATPDAAYNFGSWVVEDVDENPIAVTNNQFEMPAVNVLVTATFTLKDTYAITCAVTPEGAALMEASPVSAYEGQTVTLSYVAETGYTFSGIVITKTEDGSATGITPTASGDDYTFTMPGYAVTATATFISDTYFGSFLKFTGSAMEEGDYILVYSNKAMNNDNTTTSKKLGATDVVTTGNIITDPSRSIVWHIAPIGTEGKWTIYNAYVNKYVNASSSSSTDITLVDNASYSNGAKWSVTIDGDNNTYDFSSLTTSRALRYNNSVFGHYATSNGGPLTLYKYTVLTERTITFNGNGGTYNNESTYTQTVYDGMATTLTANRFTKANANFIGWSTTATGEVEYTDEAEITATADITLYAQWETVHTLTLSSSNAEVLVYVDGSINPIAFVNNEAQIPEGATVYVSIDGIAECFDFGGVVVTYGNNQTAPTTEEEPNVYYSFTMPTDDATLTVNTTAKPTHTLTVATLSHVTLELMAGEESDFVESGDELCEGIHVTVVATPDNGYVMGTVSVVYGNNQSVEVTTEGSNTYSFYMPTGDATINVTVEEYVAPLGGTITFGSAEGSTKINSTSVTGDDSMGNTWTITTVFPNSNTSFTQQPSYSQVGASSKPATSITFTTTLPNEVIITSFEAKFGGFSGTAGAITLKVGETTVGTGSLNATSDVTVNNTLVVSGTTLTVTVTGIDKGVKCYYISYEYVEPLHINGHNGGTGGWYLIASPVMELTPSTANGFITDEYGSSIPEGESGTYDLYYFDQTGGDNGKEWKNYRRHNFNLESGKGYLYASKEGTDLVFTGTAYSGNGVVNLTYSESETIDENMRGWNLIGNPFGTTANLPSGLSYYTLNESRTELTPGSATTIGAMKAIFVQATATGQSVTFTKQTRNAGSNAILSLNLSSVSNGLIDRAIVRFDEGNALPKFMLNPNNTKVFIPVESKDYAVVRHEAQGEMPVSFRAAENGTYTLTVNPEGVDMNYLHLIDNMTGNDVDLLATPSYTFNATTRDYESRFRLVFAANNEDGVSAGSTAFAFYSNGTWVINNTGEATLQVVDVNGRILSNETVNGSVSKAINAPAGVYMLRLINGNDVKTQKIVVR